MPNQLISYLLLASLLVLPFVYSNEVQSKSFIGNYADGYEKGKENGRDDRQDGHNKAASCPPWDSLAWCTGYKVGYQVGWIAAGAIED